MRKKSIPKRINHKKQQPVLTSIGSGSAAGLGFGIGGKPLPEELFYLVVGGGGNGGGSLYQWGSPYPYTGARGGGGGGAGGFTTNIPGQLSGGPGPLNAAGTNPIITDAKGTWTVVIGGPSTSSTFSKPGTTITGFRGGTGQQNTLSYGGPGYGSGGGGRGGNDPIAPPVVGAANPGQGHAGGIGLENNPNNSGGGGGGAGAGGGQGGPGAGSPGGAGGAGRASPATGTPVIYAGGGGGAGGSDGSTSGSGGGGGTGGGGTGKSGPIPQSGGSAGTANTGGGGGGEGLAGGSGIVILLHNSDFKQGTTTGSPEITEVNGNIIYKFTGNGSITW